MQSQAYQAIPLWIAIRSMVKQGLMTVKSLDSKALIHTRIHLN